MSCRTLERLANDAAMRAADGLEHIGDGPLLGFAADLVAGVSLDEHLIDGTAEELLRGLAYSTVLRELQRRQEVRELESNSPEAAS